MKNLLLILLASLTMASSSFAQCNLTDLRLGGMDGDQFIGPTCNGEDDFRTCFYLSGTDIPFPTVATLMLDGSSFPIAANFTDGPFTVVCFTGMSDDCAGIDVHIDIDENGMMGQPLVAEVENYMMANNKTLPAMEMLPQAVVIPNGCSITATQLFSGPVCGGSLMCTLQDGTDIPSMGTWGLIILGIILLIFGVSYLTKRRLVFGG